MAIVQCTFPDYVVKRRCVSSLLYVTQILVTPQLTTLTIWYLGGHLYSRKSSSATDKDLDLKKLSEIVEAQETGSRSSKLLCGGANVSKISDYQRSRSNILPSMLPSTTKNNDFDTCIYCGQSGHFKKPYGNVRRKKCPAWGKECHKCGSQNHFSKMCKGKKNENVTSNVADDDSHGELFNLTSTLTRPRLNRAGLEFYHMLQLTNLVNG